LKGRFTDEQIIGFLKQAEGGVAEKDLCRKHSFSDATLPLLESENLAQVSCLGDPSSAARHKA
jgi:hypothetical protein